MVWRPSIANEWRFLRALARHARAHPALLGPSLWGVGLGALYVALLAVIIAGSSVSADAETLIAFLLLGSAIGLFINWFTAAMTTVVVEMYLRGAPPDIGRAYRAARRQWDAIGTLALISALVRALTRPDGSLRAGKRGRIYLPEITRTLWRFFGNLLLPIVMTERLTVHQAVRRARDLHDGKMIRVALGELTSVGLTRLLALAAMLGFAAVVWLIAVLIDGPTALVVGVAGGALLLVVIATAIRFVRAAYFTCVYVWAIDTERHGSTALPPPILDEVVTG
jgi:hypothetical protein